jgi:hypothetical protein
MLTPLLNVLIYLLPQYIEQHSLCSITHDLRFQPPAKKSQHPILRHHIFNRLSVTHLFTMRLSIHLHHT